MNAFIASAALLTLLVVAWMAWALLRPAGASGISSQRLNATIYRDQLQALERDLDRGAISAADYQTTQDELQLRLLDDTENPSATDVTQKSYFLTAKRTSLVIALILPIGAASMYWWLGNPDALNPVAKQGQQGVTNDQIVQMVEGLAARLKANPDNPKGWAMLARSYKVMGRLEEAEAAFANVGDLVNTEPDLLVEYADLLAVKAQNNLEGKPLEMVNKALALAPQHPMGLMMSGVAAYRRSDFASAVAQWEKLMTVLDPNSPDAQQVQANIDDARAKAGMPAIADPGSSVVRAAHELGIQVVPLVGPVSLLLALAASGLNGQNFAFVGYLPQDPQERIGRIRELESLALKTGQTQLFIETPYRNLAMCQALLQTLQHNTRLAISSGLTLDRACITSDCVKQWKQKPAALDNATPAVFAIGR